MIRYNKLKIFINAGEAKPGGIIGAMLSPYLFSTNISDFCKKFNDLTKEFNNFVICTVIVFSDIIEKTYTFYLNKFSFSFFFNYYFDTFFINDRFIDLYYLFDLILFYSKNYNLDLYLSSIFIFNILKTFRKKYYYFNLAELLNLKLKKLLNK